jgi:hypothetical protein
VREQRPEEIGCKSFLFVERLRMMEQSEKNRPTKKQVDDASRKKKTRTSARFFLLRESCHDFSHAREENFSCASKKFLKFLASDHLEQKNRARFYLAASKNWLEIEKFIILRFWRLTFWILTPLLNQSRIDQTVCQNSTKKGQKSAKIDKENISVFSPTFCVFFYNPSSADSNFVRNRPF